MRLVLLILFAVNALAKEPCKDLEVVAISGYFHPLPQASFAFTDFLGKLARTVSTQSDGTGCLDLPPGRYTVKVGAMGFETLTASFEFDEGPTALVVAPRVERIHDPIIEAVRGELKGFPTKNVWVVMSHILAQERYTTRLQANGKFEFKGQFAGIYEVRAVSEGKILACTTLEKTFGDQWVDLNPKTVCGGLPAKKNRARNQ